MRTRVFASRTAKFNDSLSPFKNEHIEYEVYTTDNIVLGILYIDYLLQENLNGTRQIADCNCGLKTSFRTVAPEEYKISYATVFPNLERNELMIQVNVYKKEHKGFNHKLLGIYTDTILIQ